MTIILTGSYATFAQGATIDLDNATEASLVAQGRATYTVNPGPFFEPLTAAQQQNLRDGAVNFTAQQVASTQALVSGAGIAVSAVVYNGTGNVTSVVTAGGSSSITYNIDNLVDTITAGGVTRTAIYNADKTLASFS